MKELAELGSGYFKRSLLRKEKKKPVATYSSNHIQIGRNLKDGRVYSIDVSEACRICVIGSTRCLKKGTMVRTSDGSVPIEDAKEVLSYNFDKRRIEPKKVVNTFNNGFQETFKVITENDEIICSSNHRFYVMTPVGMDCISVSDMKSWRKDNDISLLMPKEDSVESVDVIDIQDNVWEELYDIEVEDNHNFLLDNGVLSHNSGKTWLFRVLADRLKKTEYDVIHLSDIKNEMFSSNWPLQDKFKEFLLKGEEPISYKVVSLRPTFFRTFNKNLKKFNYWYSIDMKEMSKGDFFTLVGAPKWKNANQQIALEMIYPELNKRLKNGEKFSVDLLMDIIQNIEEIDGRSTNALKMKFMPLKYYDFYDENYERSVIELLKSGYVITINLEDYDRFEKGAFMFTETTLSMVMREIIEARKNHKVRQLWLMVDESSRFLANDKNNAFKDDVLEAVDVTARYGVNFVFAWQHSGDVPDKILNQSRYIFIPAEADTKTIQNIVSNAGTTKYIQHIPNEARRLKQAARKVKHAWFIFDRRTNSIHLVKPIAPLTWHLETSH